MNLQHLPFSCDGLDLPTVAAGPDAPRALVVFVHGSGSSHLSPRNLAVAEALAGCGLASVLFDLLSPDEQRIEQRVPSDRFRLDLFSERLAACLAWLSALPRYAPLFPIGLFGASSGAGVALRVAADQPDAVAAVVSRGGRPDLAGDALERVLAPTLLIVGGADLPVLHLNRQAAARLSCPHRLVVVPGAGHLFAEPGGLEAVAGLARDWFLARLPACRQDVGSLGF